MDQTGFKTNTRIDYIIIANQRKLVKNSTISNEKKSIKIDIFYPTLNQLSSKVTRIVDETLLFLNSNQILIDKKSSLSV